MLDHTSLTELRNLILSKFDISHISPSDCQHIAITISKKLNKTISTTTIKRIFGFAAVKYNFSKFTINSLLEFVDHPNLIKARATLTRNSNDIKDAEEWLRIGTVAKAITQSTLKSIIANCTIPFKYTLSRKFALNEFENFYHSNFSFTSFLGQPGCGKSISLAHIVQHFYLKPKSEFYHDIFLFLSAKDLFTVNDGNRDFDTEIKRILALKDDQNVIRLFNSFHQKTGHKVVMIIDSFYDLFSLKRNRPQIFENIISWLCQIEDTKAIKVVISMRSHLWLRFHPMIRNSHYLNRKWYKGKHFSEREISNIPKLIEQEVTAILQQINPKTTEVIAEFAKAKLNYPFYFGYYYALKKAYGKNKFQFNVMVYEIYWRFILDEIYQSNLSAEKIMICKKIVQLSNHGLKSTAIPKKMLFHDFLKFKEAYAELLKKGIIIEHKTITNGLFIETVEFFYPLFFDYFLSEELAEKLPEELDPLIVEKMLANYPKILTENAIKWMIFTTVRSNNYKFNYLLDNPSKTHDELTLFFVENIKHLISLKPFDLAALKNIIGKEILIKHNIIS